MTVIGDAVVDDAGNLWYQVDAGGFIPAYAVAPMGAPAQASESSFQAWEEPAYTEYAQEAPVDPNWQDPAAVDPGYVDPNYVDPGYTDYAQEAPAEEVWTEPAPVDPAYTEAPVQEIAYNEAPAEEVWTEAAPAADQTWTEEAPMTADPNQVPAPTEEVWTEEAPVDDGTWTEEAPVPAEETTWTEEAPPAQDETWTEEAPPAEDTTWSEDAPPANPDGTWQDPNAAPPVDPNAGGEPVVTEDAVWSEEPVYDEPAAEPAVDAAQERNGRNNGNANNRRGNRGNAGNDGASGASTENGGEGEAPTGNGSGQSIADYAMGFVGYPYAYAGEGPNAFDCSGFTKYVIQQTLGMDITHDMFTQVGMGQSVDKGELQPGDLVFFQNTFRGGLSHAGIYVGGGQFVHAENESTGVRVSDINSDYYGSRWYGAVRLT